MSLLEKFYTPIIFISVLIGILLGNIDFFKEYAEFGITPLLIGMLYITFLQIPLSEIKNAFKNKKFTYSSVLVNFLWTPIFAYILGQVFLEAHHALIIGFIMLLVTPCTDWYLIFTGISKGNVALSASILPLNLVLQVLLLPLYLLLFNGTSGTLDLSALLEGIITVLVIPFLLAELTRFFLKNHKENLLTRLSNLPILFLSLAITAMFASQGQLLLQNLDLLWKLTIPLLIFFAVNFILSQQLGKAIGFSYPERASLSLTTLARNSPVALAIALASFPDEPLIALTLIIGPLLELPVLSILSHRLLFLRKKESYQKHAL